MKLYAAAAIAAGMLVASAANAGVVFSENFEGYDAGAILHGAHTATSSTGNTISSDYSYRVPGHGNTSGDADSMYDEGTWTIANNPIDVHNLWIDLPSNAQTGQMLIVNGSTQPGSTIIGDPNAAPVAYLGNGVSVAAGTYTFSYNLLNVCCNASGPAHTPSVLDLWYTDGSGSPLSFVVLTEDTTSVDSNGWGTISGSFTLASAGTIHIGLSDTADAASGNDFGIDNIVIASPEPATWALMLLGFGGVGAMMRRRRTAAAA